jgi:hypothetical protein
MHELRKVLATPSSTMQLIRGHIQLGTRKGGHADNECYRRQQDIPLFVFQTKAEAIFATHITAYGFAGVCDVL